MQPVKLPNDGIMNAGTIKIGKSGEIIFQFKNYHHIIDGETELYYAHMVERKINELNQALQKANEENERLKKNEFQSFFTKRTCSKIERILYAGRKLPWA